jgi:hypothetical protein
MPPVRLFLSRYKYNRLEGKPMFRGIEPTSMLAERSRDVSLEQFTSAITASRMFPWNKLSARSRSSNFLRGPRGRN